MLAKTRQYVEAMTRQLDDYEVANACDSTRNFLDVLTNWYIRRSRDRFWAEDSAAFDTLYTVLETVCRVTAPLMPLTTEEVWRGLTGERSVHLTDWPDASALPADDALVAAMDQVREVCSAGSALRKAASLRTRLPLASLTVVVADPAALEGFESLVADELNLKQVRLLDAAAPEAAAYGVSQRLSVNARAAGPRLGKDVQAAIKGSKSGDWSVAEDGTVTAGGLLLEEGEFTLDTVAGGGEGVATGVLPGGGLRRARHRRHSGAGGRGARPRRRARRAAGPQGRRARGVRPDLADGRRLRRDPRCRRGTPRPDRDRDTRDDAARSAMRRPPSPSRSRW